MTSSYTARYGGEDADLEPRPLGQLADHAYIVCSTPRSGSNLLGDAVRSSGGLGVPMEYLDQQAAMPMLMRRWGCDDLASYLANLHAHRTDTTGWLGLKAHWHQLQAFFELLDGQPWHTERAAVLRQVIEQLFPDTRWIRLHRQDTVSAAVSFHRAAATGRFVDLGDGTTAEDPPLTPRAVTRMAELVDQFETWDDSWERFFDAAGIEPYRLTYDELTADVPGTVAAVRDWLGVGAGDTPAPSTRRQAGAWSGEARALVLAELAERGAREGTT